MIAVNKYFDSDQTAIAVAKALLNKGLKDQNADLYDMGLGRYNAAVESIEKKDEWYQYLLERYSEAVRLGNDYIDVDETLDSLREDGKDFVQALKKYDIRRFTFSRSQSAVQYEVREFLDCGCKLIDVVHITEEQYPPEGPEYVDTLAFLLEV